MKYAWLSDIHLDHLANEDFIAFMDELIRLPVDGYFVTGDITHALMHETVFAVLERFLSKPFYFILGNHDYYNSSFTAVERRVLDLTGNSKNMIWMSKSGIVELSKKTALIGHEGWYDGRNGDFWGTDYHLSDFLLIEDLVALEPAELLIKLHELGDRATNYFRMVLPQALEKHNTVYLLTHVSPFVETSFYNRGISDKYGLPFFSCKALGDYLLEEMKQNPDKQLVVLCGHTHTGGEKDILPNLHVKVATARYGQPKVEEIVEIA